MVELSNELIAKLKKAQSIEEVTELLKADGQETDEQVIQQIWTELTKHRKEDEQKLSLDELDEVSGGKDRDWAKEGCAATVECGSWCWSNDRCVTWDVTYDHPPTEYKCSRCGKPLYQGKGNGTATPLYCRFCDG